MRRGGKGKEGEEKGKERGYLRKGRGVFCEPAGEGRRQKSGERLTPF